MADVEGWLLANSGHFPHGEEETRTIISQLKGKQISTTTTSCGRVLDALSAVLGICHERTYQGEPAMKLESVAVSGKDALKLEPEISNGVLNTTNLVQAVFKAKAMSSIEDLAYSAESYLAKGIAQIAVEAAQRTGVDAVGFSGGVAYNKHIALAIRKHVEESGLKFYVHEALPAGDGGISFGQALAATFSLDHRN
jgi:hydrogenase maturation protein HypF